MRQPFCSALLSTLFVLSACGGGGTGTCITPVSACPAVVPSWSTEVKAINDAACAQCHRQGGIGAPRIFETPADFQSELPSALSQIESCKMPQASVSLADADRSTLETWLLCGAPQN